MQEPSLCSFLNLFHLWIYDVWSEWIRSARWHHHMIWSLSSFEFQVICPILLRKIVTKFFLIIDHSSQYIFINKSVFAKHSTMNFDTIPESFFDTSDVFLSVTSFSSLCACSLSSRDRKKSPCKKCFFSTFRACTKKYIAFHPPSYHEKTISHEIFNLVSFITCSAPQSSGILYHQYLIPSSSYHELPRYLCIF